MPAPISKRLRRRPRGLSDYSRFKGFALRRRQAMSKAPYDDRNDADFREISSRIRSALDRMEMDPTIPARETELAARASCSRGTLRNRVWPLDRLKTIKQQRLQQ